MKWNFYDFFIVGVMAFIFIWLVNRGLRAANLGAYAA